MSRVNRRKLAALQKRIVSGKYWVPKVGDYIYTETRLSIDHGWDDVVGGLSTVTKVYSQMSGGDPACVFVEIKEHNRGGNWTQVFFEEQKTLMLGFGESFAYPDPDE
jgi:hypothetical protein